MFFKTKNSQMIRKFVSVTNATDHLNACEKITQKKFNYISVTE